MEAAREQLRPSPHPGVYLIRPRCRRFDATRKRDPPQNNHRGDRDPQRVGQYLGGLYDAVEESGRRYGCRKLWTRRETTIRRQLGQQHPKHTSCNCWRNGGLSRKVQGLCDLLGSRELRTDGPAVRSSSRKPWIRDHRCIRDGYDYRYQLLITRIVRLTAVPQWPPRRTPRSQQT